MYPHLAGNPQDETIGHYIAIGGWNDNTGQVWYADSATTVWSGVAAYSWYIATARAPSVVSCG